MREATHGATLTAQETKEQVLWVAQGDAAQRTSWRAPPATSAARLPDGNAVLTPSSLDYTGDDARRPRRRATSTATCSRASAARRREKALHLSALRLHPEIDATMHCHAKYATMFALVARADPRRDRGVRRVRRRRRRGRRLQDDRHRRARRRGRRSGSRTGVPCSWRTTGCSRWARDPKDVLHIATLVERTAEIIWGARALGDGRAAPRRGRNEPFPGYYRYGRTGKF